jgi:hypothetical protein
MLVAAFHPEVPATVATVLPVLLVAFAYGVPTNLLTAWLNRQPFEARRRQREQRLLGWEGPARYLLRIIYGEVNYDPETYMRMLPLAWERRKKLNRSPLYRWRHRNSPPMVVQMMQMFDLSDLKQMGAPELSDEERVLLDGLLKKIPGPENLWRAEELIDLRMSDTTVQP